MKTILNTLKIFQHILFHKMAEISNDYRLLFYAALLYIFQIAVLFHTNFCTETHKIF